MISPKPSVVIIGSGNVAYALGKLFHEHDIEIKQIFSRNEAHAKNLSQILTTNYCAQLSAIDISADYYFLCIKDDAIHDVSLQLKNYLPPTKFILHTSGSRNKDEIDAYFSHRINFYPLQSFTFNQAVLWSEIPIFIHCSADDYAIISSFAQQFTQHVYALDDRKRKAIHVAAVYVNNFNNANFIIAKKILDQESLDLDILMPLIKKTINKLSDTAPEQAQTGPAQRNDIHTIEIHQKFLESNFKNFLENYNAQTNVILKKFEA